MSRNGSGTYTPPAGSWTNPVNGQAATSGDWTALLNDLSAALTQSVSRDGQSPLTGNLNLGGNKITDLSDASGTGQALTFAQLFNQGTEQDLASAATTDIGAQLTNFLRITGTTTITSFGTNYKGPRFLRFAGAVLLTNSATLALPGGANITTAAGDCLIAIPTATLGTADGWRVVAYQKNAVPGTVADGSISTAKLSTDLQNATYGFKNRIINGAMVIDQRNAGTSVTLTNAGFTYPVDRFFAFRNTGTSGITAQRVSSGLTDTPFAIRVQRTNGDTSTTSNGFGQTIESNNSYDLAGNNISLSFKVRCGANFSATSSQITARITTGTAADQGSNAGFQGAFTGQVNTNTAVTLTTSWQTFTVTLAAPSNALEYQLLFYWANTGTAGANDWVEITGVQLEKGSTATSFDYRPYGTELALCQRYFNTVKAITGTNGNTSSTVYANVPYSEMRATPTYAVTGALVFTEPGVATRTQSSGDVSIAGSGYTNAAFLAFGNMSAITAYRVMVLNSSSTYLTLSAEL